MDPKVAIIFLGELPEGEVRRVWETLIDDLNEDERMSFCGVYHPKTWPATLPNPTWATDINVVNVDEDHHLETEWSQPSILYATLLCIQFARRSFSNIRKYILVSSTCCPIVSLRCILFTCLGDIRSQMMHLDLSRAGLPQTSDTELPIHTSQFFCLDSNLIDPMFPNNTTPYIKIKPSNIGLDPDLKQTHPEWFQRTMALFWGHEEVSLDEWFFGTLVFSNLYHQNPQIACGDICKTHLLCSTKDNITTRYNKYMENFCDDPRTRGLTRRQGIGNDDDTLLIPNFFIGRPLVIGGDSIKLACENTYLSPSSYTNWAMYNISPRNIARTVELPPEFLTLRDDEDVRRASLDHAIPDYSSTKLPWYHPLEYESFTFLSMRNMYRFLSIRKPFLEKRFEDEKAQSELINAYIYISRVMRISLDTTDPADLDRVVFAGVTPSDICMAWAMGSFFLRKCLPGSGITQFLDSIRCESYI